MCVLTAMSVAIALKVLEVNRASRITVLHGQDSGYGGLAAVLAGKLLNVPVILTSHGVRLLSLELILKGPLRGVLLAIERMIDQFTLKEANSIVAINDSVKRELVRRGVSERRILIIPNAIETRRFSRRRSAAARSRLRDELGLRKGETAVGFVGRFSAEKNLMTLLTAFARALPRCRRVRLLLVGDGPLRHELEKSAIRLGIQDRVVFTGFRDDIDQVMNGIDIFVIPSYLEGMPTALLEAMASGKPTIVSDIPMIRDVVAGSRCAIPVDPRNPDGIASAIVRLCRDPRLRTNLGRAALQTAKQYDIEAVSHKLAVLYGSVSTSRTS